MTIPENTGDFATEFKDFLDCFVVVGGTPAALYMEQRIGFNKATKDLDIVILEKGDTERAKQFFTSLKKYIEDHGYKSEELKSGKAQAFRFTNPTSGKLAPKEIEIPPGYCFKLKKSLYGLKTWPRSWNRHLNQFIKSLGFTQCVLDTCLYYKYKDGRIALLAVYVDDIMIASADVEYIKEIKKQFCKKFDMTDIYGRVASFFEYQDHEDARVY